MFLFSYSFPIWSNNLGYIISLIYCNLPSIVPLWQDRKERRSRKVKSFQKPVVAAKLINPKVRYLGINRSENYLKGFLFFVKEKSLLCNLIIFSFSTNIVTWRHSQVSFIHKISSFLHLKCVNNFRQETRIYSCVFGFPLSVHKLYIKDENSHQEGNQWFSVLFFKPQAKHFHCYQSSWVWGGPDLKITIKSHLRAACQLPVRVTLKHVLIPSRHSEDQKDFKLTTDLNCNM